MVQRPEGWNQIRVSLSNSMFMPLTSLESWLLQSDPWTPSSAKMVLSAWTVPPYFLTALEGQAVNPFPALAKSGQIQNIFI